MKTLALFFLNYARKAGLDIISSLVNLGIEAAMQSVRGNSQ